MAAEPDEQDEGRDELADGVEHLQAAAKELIKAGRSLLDAVEGLVEDPSALQGVVSTLGSLAQAAARSLRPDGAGHDGDEGGKVQHIPLS
jgi:hypothetical protein